MVPFWKPSARRGYVGLHPGFVNEHQPCRANARLMSLPQLPAALHIRAVPRVRNQRLFLKLNPQPRGNRQTVSWLTSILRSAANLSGSNANVTCGQAPVPEPEATPGTARGSAAIPAHLRRAHRSAPRHTMPRPFHQAERRDPEPSRNVAAVLAGLRRRYNAFAKVV